MKKELRCYVRGLTSHDDYNRYVLHTSTNKTFKNTQIGRNINLINNKRGDWESTASCAISYGSLALGPRLAADTGKFFWFDSLMSSLLWLCTVLASLFGQLT